MNKKNNHGYNIIEIVISLTIILIGGLSVFSLMKKSREYSITEKEKLNIIMTINNAALESTNKSIKNIILFNTQSSDYEKGIFIYRVPFLDPVLNTLSGGGFKKETLTSPNFLYYTPSQGEKPTPSSIFQCNFPNSIIKACPVVVFEDEPASSISYNNNSISLPNISLFWGHTNNNFTIYTFGIDNYPKYRIFFYSTNSSLQIQIYKYIGEKKSAVLRDETGDNIKTYHLNRLSLFNPAEDSDWKEEKYYPIPIKTN